MAFIYRPLSCSHCHRASHEVLLQAGVAGQGCRKVQVPGIGVVLLGPSFVLLSQICLSPVCAVVFGPFRRRTCVQVKKLPLIVGCSIGHSGLMSKSNGMKHFAHSCCSGLLSELCWSEVKEPVPSEWERREMCFLCLNKN